MSVNKVILIGNLGKDPEVRRLNFGDKAFQASLAAVRNMIESWAARSSARSASRS
jgi:single-strand DNA-binding protein